MWVKNAWRKGTGLKFPICKKTLMNGIYDFFQVEMFVYMNQKSAIGVSSSFFYILTRQVGQWVPKKLAFFFFFIGTNPSTFSYCSNCVCILCFLVSFPWHFYLHKVVFAYDSVLWNNLQLTVIFNGLKMYLQSHWIIFDSLIGSSVFEELNKSSSICGFLSFL